ncbi:MAG: hypothetical protein VB070_01775 [Clostridiaceae bacterium]|nr:hypothetical protein [Clostridiaceae bacterium]
MVEELFPRTLVDGVSVSRLIIGTNWLNGYSHTSAAADAGIKNLNQTTANAVAILEEFLAAGVDTIMGGMSQLVVDAVHIAEERTGKKIIIIDTPPFDCSDTAAGRQDAAAAFDRSRQIGATFCFPHHSTAEQLVRKDKHTIERLPDYLEMIRDRGLIPGLSAHMPELILYSDEQNYDVASYIQIYNCMGFLMQIEIESVNKIIWQAKKPVMTIKPMAAGRTTPFVGLNFSWNTLRSRDMVTIGCMTPAEAFEVIEISLAAINRRQVNLEGRGSLCKTAIIK